MDSNQEIWEKVFVENEWGKYPETALIRFIARNFYKSANRAKVNILELGCGPGANLWYLTREGFSVSAIEYSKTAAERGTARLRAENLIDRLSSIKIGDYFDAVSEFPNDFFDAVIDYESLYCNSFDKTKSIIDKVVQKLKPGGLFFSVTFADGTWGFEGEEKEYHAVFATEGPLADKGFSRYSTRDDVMTLYNTPRLELISLEKLEKQLNNGKSVKEWIVEARRRS